MLDTKHLFPITLSSSAPAYSAIVTAPIIVSMCGLWSIGIYLVAAALSWYVSTAYERNTAVRPDRGTVYSWNTGAFAWLNGYALAVTGIVATSGLAYVAATGLLSLFGVSSMTAALILGAVMIALAQVLNNISLKVTSVVQILALIAHIAAGIALIVLMFVADQAPIQPALTFGGIIEGLLIAVFAFWGFDTAFALAEESDTGAPRTASRLSIITMTITFVLVAVVISLYGIDAVVTHPLVVIAVSLSAMMALGSTLLPTVRGVEAMAEKHDLPNLFAHGLKAEVTTAVLSIAILMLVLLNEGFFYDLIDCLSIFVGFYYAGAIFAHYRNGGAKSALGMFVLMLAVTLAAGIYMLTPTYGNTVFGPVSGVAVLGGALAVLGVLLYLVNQAVKPATHK